VGWFCKQLPQSTNADLEVRLCSASTANVENTPIEPIEIYVMTSENYPDNTKTVMHNRTINLLYVLD
jgi:hypothetical protein